MNPRQDASKIRCRGLIAILLFAGIAAAELPHAPGKSAPPAGPFEDAWLSAVLLDKLKTAAQSHRLDELGGQVRAAILARLRCGHLDRLRALNDMVYVLRACEYLPVADKLSKEGQLVAFLLANRGVSRRLFRALARKRDPQNALADLAILLQTGEETVKKYPDLAVAFAAARPRRHYREPPEPASLLDSFRWYTDPRNRFHYDLRKMPFELSQYLADTRISIKERKWAAGRYGRNRNPARCYFDLRYDREHYRGGKPKKIAKLPYSLDNLLRVGGVCIEQAYYAGEVCKALGIPATIVVGAGKSGTGHAWVASLKITGGGKQVYWDCTTGRYREHQYFAGDAYDPLTGRKIPDSELMLVGAAAQLPLQRREEADTALTLAKLVEQVRDDQDTPEMAVLATLAEEYNKARADSAKPQAPVAARMTPVRKLDLAMVEDLIARAVERNLATGSAWSFVIQLRKSNRMPVEHLDRFFDILVTRTAKAYPDYSCQMVMEIVPTIEEAPKRERVYRKALRVYGKRPDLQGRILIALGQDYETQGQKSKALKAYETAATQCVSVAEIVVRAAEAAERLLMLAERPDLAIRMYEKLFDRAQKQKSAAVFSRQTARYKLGQRLASLLADAGKEKAAKQIYDQIGR